VRALPSGFEAAFENGTTTHCWCWRIERRDGLIQGFTDHDRIISFDGVIYDPETGFSAGTVERSLGLAPDNSEVVGALRSDRISAQDLAAGLYDGAQVRVYRVDWGTPSSNVLMRAARLGEVRHGGAGFTAELVGPLDGLNTSILRSFQYHCDAQLGDMRCGVELAGPDFTSTGAVAKVLSGGTFATHDLSAFETGWFSGGQLTWQTGANADISIPVSAHIRNEDSDVLSLWDAPAHPPSPDDVFSITAGCDKRAETCAQKFSNIENFRGFPHMPGNDFFFSYPGSK
jgi:uncharacterized phage protein (TIGR02218 family)